MAQTNVGAQAQQSNNNTQQDVLMKRMNALVEEMRRNTTSRKSDMKNTLEGPGKRIMASAMGPLMKVADIIQKMVSLLVMPFANVIIPLLLPILYFLAPLVKFMNQMLRPFFTEMMTWAKIMRPVIVDLAKKMMEGPAGIVQGILGMVDVLWEGISKVLDFFVGLVMDFIDAIDWNAVWDELTAFATKMWNKISPYIDTIVAKITGTANDLYPKIQAFLKPHIDNIITYLKGLWYTYVSPILAPIERSISKIISKFSNVIDETIFSINTFIVDIAKVIADISKNFFTALSGFMKTVGETVQELMAGLSGVVDIVYKFFDFAGNVVSILKDAFVSFFQKMDEITYYLSMGTNSGSNRLNINKLNETKFKPGGELSEAAQKILDAGKTFNSGMKTSSDDFALSASNSGDIVTASQKLQINAEPITTKLDDLAMIMREIAYNTANQAAIQARINLGSAENVAASATIKKQNDTYWWGEIVNGSVTPGSS